MPKDLQEDETIPTVRLELDKIKTKRHSIYRPSTYTTMLRLYRIKKVSIRRRFCVALRV